MRRRDGDEIRLFNTRQGEHLAMITHEGKKDLRVTLQSVLHEQPPAAPALRFYFAPIKSSRMDWMIEKAVELGATDFHPVLTQNTEVRKLKTDRIEKQLIEAAEQCERFVIPQLHDLCDFKDAVNAHPETDTFYACLERFDAKTFSDMEASDFQKPLSFLIGPVGGFTDDEKNYLANKDYIQPVSFGDTVLRCETAACFFLSIIKLYRT